MTGARLSVAIMAHPDRAEQVAELRAALRPRETGPDVATVVWDEQSNEWHTGRRALLAYDPDATHHLVLQDDAVVCRDLVAGVEAALDVVPDRAVVSLYLGRARPYATRISRAISGLGDGDAWLVLDDLCWGVAVVVPTDLLPPLVAEADRSRLAEYDRRISGYLRREQIQVWHPWPSLVDHAAGPSLLAHDRPSDEPRVAHRFVGATASALDVDYRSGGIVRLSVRRTMRVPTPVSARPRVSRRVERRSD